MKIIADLHCHTIASIHAYSTLRENIEAAKRMELAAIAITDHGIGGKDSPSLNYFENLTSLPQYVDDVLILKGVEANIMAYDGKLDIPDDVMRSLDIVIASLHTSVIAPGTFEQHTNAYTNVAKNKYVHIIGHCGSQEFVFDYEKVIPIFKEYGKIVEINAHTFICRDKSIPNCKKIALLCKKYKLPIVINSDAHSEFEVGQCALVYEMLKEIEFPKELIININTERFHRYLKEIGITL